MRSVTTEALPDLLAEGARYIDVRTPEEFAAGHVPGAYNVPVSFGSLSGLYPNPDFARVALASFELSDPLVIGCHSGGRAKAAAGILQQAGFRQLHLDEQGWDGSRDAFGRLTPGWRHLPREQEQGQPISRSYSTLAGNLLRPAE